MKWLACIALISCAPPVLVAPSSLPALRVDGSLVGPVLSREAAQIVVAKRATERADFERKLLDLWADYKTSQAELKAANERAENAAWWAHWGPMLLGIGIPSVAVLSIAGGLLLGGRFNAR